MKYFFMTVLFVLLSVGTLFAQNQLDTVKKADSPDTLQKDSVIVSSKKETVKHRILGTQANMKGSIDWGASCGASIFLFAGFLETDATVAYRFNEYRSVGLGSGYHDLGYINIFSDKGSGDVKMIPLYATYRRYYPVNKRENISFFMGADLGASYIIGGDHDSDNSLFNVMATAKVGWEFRIAKSFAAFIDIHIHQEIIPAAGVAVGVSF